MKKKSLVLASAVLFGIFMAYNPSSACGCIPSELETLMKEGPGETRAVLLLKDGKVEEKRYSSGYSDKTRFVSWSMAKSVTAVLIGELVADGKLKLDDPVPFNEWKKPGDPRGAITLRHMLNMSSGLEHKEGLDPGDGPDALVNADTPSKLFVGGTNAMAAPVLAKGMEAKPGEKYEYSSMTSLLLSELITRQLTNSTNPRERASAFKAFAEERLFKPAGIATAFLEFDGAGTQVGGSMIYMNLDDWGRFGQVLLNGKGPDGSQVVAPEWLTVLRTPSATDPGYGGHFWLNRPRAKDHEKYPALFPGKGPASIFAAVGHLGQYVIISPDDGRVLVHLGKTQDGELQGVRDMLGNVMAGISSYEQENPQK